MSFRVVYLLFLPLHYPSDLKICRTRLFQLMAESGSGNRLFPLWDRAVYLSYPSYPNSGLVSFSPGRPDPLMDNL
jgi:hypothetical protein